MIVAAIITGFISSYYLAAIHSRQILTLIHHVPYRFYKPYLSLYDELESNDTYLLLGGEQRFKNYQVFLHEYQKLRPHATEHFRGLWSTYSKQIGRDYGLIIVVSLGLFWRDWWIFILSFVLVQLGLILHLRYVKQEDTRMFSSLLVSLLMAQSGVVKTTADFIKRSE